MDPITVHASPLPDQLWAGLRQIAPAVVTFALGKGWLDNDSAALLAVLGGVAWPIVAGQLKTRRRAQELAVVASAAPDHVATVK
jgi:uncharacterized membrane protein